MSGLIKSSEARSYQALRDALAPLAMQPDVDISSSDREIARLQDEIEALRAIHAQCAGAIDTARSEGIHEGRALAQQAFDESRAGALDRLEVACNRAIEHFSCNILAVERLSTLIAQTVLEQMLLGETHYRDIAREAIVARIREIERSSVLRMLVSARDFPDQRELEDLSDLCGVDLAVITQSTELDAGQCRVDLTLGTLDIGLLQQWEKLNRELQNASDQGEER